VPRGHLVLISCFPLPWFFGEWIRTSETEANLWEGFPLQEMNAVNAIHYQRQFMNRRMPRPAGADPALPVLPDQGPGRDLPYLPREPYLGRPFGDGKFFLGNREIYVTHIDVQ